MQPALIGLGTSSTDASTLGLTYNYGTTNNNGNLQTVAYAGGGLSYTQTFGYDSLNRLTTSAESGSSWSQTNSYDRYGNRSIVGGGLSFSASNNRITNAGYLYDAAGNLTNDSTQSFAFDGENKIKTVNGESDVYRYDGDGNRVRKNFTNGEKVRMVYGGGQLIAEYDLSNGSLKKEYVYGPKGLIATIEPANGTRYTTSDHLGSPRIVTNSSAGVVSRHDYMPFGEEIGTGIGGRTTGMGFSVADGVRQKFTSKERDNETGLDYFLARYYSSTQGRFTSPDEFSGGPDELYDFTQTASENPTFYADLAEPQSLNKYQYSYNNPLSFIDPDGHQGQGKKTVTERLKEGARSVGRTLVRTANGAASAISENNGLGPMDAEQNSVGRAIGHGLTGVQVGVEIYGGVQTIAGGAASLIVTVPACGTGAGCVATAASVGTVAVGAVVTTHGGLVGINTVNNIFSKKTELSKQKKHRSVEGTTEQVKGLEKKQEATTKRGGYRISTEKSKQNVKKALKDYAKDPKAPDQ